MKAIHQDNIDRFWSNASFLSPQKTSEKRMFSDVFRENKDRTLNWNELIAKQRYFGAQKVFSFDYWVEFWVVFLILIIMMIITKFHYCHNCFVLPSKTFSFFSLMHFYAEYLLLVLIHLLVYQWQ